MRFAAFLIAFSFLQVTVNASKILGFVKDASDSSALMGVIVSIQNTDRFSQTDVDGRFEIDKLDNGSYEILVSYVSYKKYSETIIISGSKDVELNIMLKADGKELKGVSVTATRTTNTENSVIQELRRVNSIASGISAAQISKTMDRNAADVVKRVPGVTVRDDRFIVVRGLYDRYNTVWLNDGAAPGSEVDRKSFSFDLIPSGLIDRILIFKTPSPELPGDFAGGMVKVYTTSLPSRTQYRIGFQSSYRQYSTGSDLYYSKGSSTDWLGYDNHVRSLPENAPAHLEKNSDENKQLSKSFGNDWILYKKKQPMDIRLSLSASHLFSLGRVKIGNTFGLSYSQVSTNYLYSRQDWEQDSAKTLLYSYGDLKSSAKVSTGLLDNLIFVVGNSKIEFKNLYSQIGNSSNIQRVNIKDSALAIKDEKAYQMGYESRATYASQLLGTHKNADESRKYTWALGYTDLFKDEPNMRRIRYTKNAEEDDSNYIASIAGVVDPVYGGGRLYGRLAENVYSFSQQFSQRFSIMDIFPEVSLGSYIEYKDRTSTYRTLGYVSTTFGPNTNRLKRLPVDRIFADENVGEVGTFLMDEITNDYDQYSAQNKLIAGFLCLKVPIGKLVVIGGARYEHNLQSLQSVVNLDTLTPDVTTKFLLPSVNLSYNFTKNSLVRLAYGKTLNRPEFREWAPVHYYDFDNRYGIHGSLYPNAFSPGGDTLRVALVQNIDVRYEWYPSDGEQVHAGLFYKSFKDPIQLIQIPGFGKDSRTLTFVNATSAYVYGVELEIRKTLDFLDGVTSSGFFKSFVLVGNLSLSKSELRLDSARITDIVPVTTMQGQSPYVVNVGLFYQNDLSGFQGSVLYNVFGPRNYSVGTIDDPSLGELPVSSLDLTLSKTFFKHYTLSFGVQNLLNSPVRVVIDTNEDGKFSASDKNFSSYRPGIYYTAGLQVKF